MDNVILNLGSGGDTVSADDIAGVKVQRVKVQHGADGSATDVSTASPLPVTLANTGANATAVKTDGSAVTQPVSASSLPLPAGAATVAKQPALGTAGSAAADVLSIQGVASMTAVKTDGSAVTQPVSGTVAATQSGTWSTRTQDGAGNALTSKAPGAERALSVAIVDGAGAQITSFGGGTQYAEDAASAGGESLTLTGVVRQDSISSSTSADGDYATLKANSVGRLYTSATVDAALPVGTNSIGQVTANAGTNLNTSALAVESGGNLATLAGAVRAEDAASADGHTGIPALAVRKATPANTSGTDGDYEMLQLSAGRLWTSSTIDAALPAGSNTIGALTANQSVNVAQVNGVAPTMGNGAAGTGVQRVTLASDSTGQVTLASGAALSSITTSVTPGTGAANLGKAEDAAHASGDTGVMALAVQQAANTSLVSTDGDYGPLQLDANGSLKVAIISGAGSGGTAQTDGATYTAATTSGTPIMAARDDSSTSTLAEDKVGILRATTNRALHVNLRDASGTELSVGGGTQYTEDAAAVADPVGNAIIVVRNDARSGSLVSADGDNIALRGTNNGELYVKQTDAVPVTDNGGNLSIDDGGNSITVDGTVAISSLPASTNTLEVVGDVAHDGVAAGNPVLMGAYASTATPSAISADGDAVHLWATTTGALNVADAGGSLTVDGTVAVSAVTAGTSATALGKAVDGAAGGTDTGVMALAVRDDALATLTPVDGDYTQLRTDSTGALWVNVTNGISGIAEDTASAGGETGLAVLAVRRDSASSGVSTDGDFANLSVDVNGALRVTGGGGGTQYVEDIASTGGETMTLAGAVRQDTISSNTSTDGDYTYLKTNSAGRLYASATVDAALPAGANVIGAVTQSGTWNVGTLTTITNAVHVDDNAGSLTVDNGGTFAVQATIASGATAIAKAEDAASADADVGVPAMAVRKATPANTSGTDGDYEMLQMSAGRLWASATIDAALPAGANVIGALSANQSTNVAQINGVTPLMGNGASGTGAQRVTIANDSTGQIIALGAAAHGASIAGAPVRLGGRALTADYTALTAGQTADLITTLLGKLVTIPYANPNQTWSSAAASGGIVNTTGVTAKAAAGANIRNYITHVSVVNGHATVDTDVQIRDGAAGTVLWRGFAKAAGGGVSESFDPPLRGTANTLVEIANGTTGAATYFNCQGFVAAE